MSTYLIYVQKHLFLKSNIFWNSYLVTRLKLAWTYLAVNALTCNSLLKDRITKL